jgi:hypothetical protein
VERILRASREEALQVLRENRGQSREGVDILVKERLASIVAASGTNANLSTEQLEALYNEMLDLSYAIFSLGYAMAATLAAQEPTKR